MGRRSGASRGPRAAPSRPAPGRAPPAQQQRQASSSSVPARKPAAPPAATPAPAPAPAAAPQSSGPGFFAGMAQIAGGVAMGHAITGAVSGLMSSGDDGAASSQEGHFDSQQTLDNPCFDTHQMLLQCLSQRRGDVSGCQYMVDMFNECQDNHARVQQ